MDKIINKELCTGCTACVNICPKKAIIMTENTEGFKHPIIDEKKCINCGLCKKTCPILNTKSNHAINKCYVGYSLEDKTKKESSSGGIFTLIANHILENKGIIIGAAFNTDNKLIHIAIKNKDDLKKLRGSKYLQSDLNNIFAYIKENISSKKVLFVGTPCQVAGLKSFLKKDYENLICIDLFCHGVPSPKLFSKYIHELEEKNNDKLINYNFRDKVTGWDAYSNTATFKNNCITEYGTKNNYMKLFLADVALRQSCYNCNFKLGNKYSDVTLGDFWGVKNHYPEMYSKDGVSAIIINSNKGLKLFELIKNNIKYKECQLDEILLGNKSLKCSSKKNTKRKSFFEELDKHTVEELTKKYVKKTSLFRKTLRKAKRTFFNHS